jgi:hypothetical protein
VKATKARQLGEKQDVQIAHNMQFAEFNAAWDKYMQEYDQMAQVGSAVRADCVCVASVGSRCACAGNGTIAKRPSGGACARPPFRAVLRLAFGYGGGA